MRLCRVNRKIGPQLWHDFLLNQKDASSLWGRICQMSFQIFPLKSWVGKHLHHHLWAHTSILQVLPCTTPDPMATAPVCFYADVERNSEKAPYLIQAGSAFIPEMRAQRTRIQRQALPDFHCDKLHGFKA